MTPVLQDPVALLRSLQQQSMARAPRLPQEVEAAVLWSGVGFRLDELRLVSPLDQVSEVLPCPAMTPVPGTKPWLKGVANVRGNLVTIIDMAEYFGKAPVYADERARILVMNIPGLNTALMVHEVLGLRHFDEELERQDLSGLDDPVLAHLSGAFLQGESLWGVFDMKSLADSMTFRHVAA
jgi:twitching motility protein PilI